MNRMERGSCSAKGRLRSSSYWWGSRATAALAAILFPVFAEARAKARQANHLSNLKQLVMGWLMYAQDHDVRFVPRGVFVNNCPDGSRKPWGFWCVGVMPYVENHQISRALQFKANVTAP